MKNKSKANRYKVMGRSVTSVLRRLGREGVTVKRARSIMKALKVNVSKTSCVIFVTMGRSQDCELPLADLTKKEVVDLVSLAPE